VRGDPLDLGVTLDEAGGDEVDGVLVVTPEDELAGKFLSGFLDLDGLLDDLFDDLGDDLFLFFFDDDGFFDDFFDDLGDLNDLRFAGSEGTDGCADAKGPQESTTR